MAEITPADLGWRRLRGQDSLLSQKQPFAPSRRTADISTFSDILRRMELRRLPYVLIVVRAICGVVALILSFSVGNSAQWLCVAMLAIGVLSDIFDGVIARNIGSVTDHLRLWDSRVDVLFWLCITAALLVMHPRLFSSTWPLVATLGSMEVATHTLSFIRFGREASPHHILSKVFALALWALVSVLFVTGRAGWPQYVVLALGVASQLEAFAITLLLPKWQPDVSSWRAALALRRSQRHVVL